MSSVEWADVQESYNYQRGPSSTSWEELSEFARKVWRLHRRWIQSADFAGPPDPLPFAKKLRKLVIRGVAAVIERAFPDATVHRYDDLQYLVTSWPAPTERRSR